MKIYTINEIFYSIQGEGIRQGTANVFVRFSGCNLRCNRMDEISGFDCDTEFTSGEGISSGELLKRIRKTGLDCNNVILTGGEPSLQVDDELISVLKKNGFFIAIETNGTRELPTGIDWITVSPKTAEHTLKQKFAEELKYVRNQNQSIPKPSIKADNYLISPAFEATGEVLPETLNHCISLVKNHPEWRLSLQLHKFLRIR